MHLPHTHAVGIRRREFLQVGYSALLGLSLSGSLGATESARPRRRKSVILVFNTGASSHLDTFDPKPDAPAEIRGEFESLRTNVPGIYLSEHLPKLATCADRFALVRSMSHRDNNHTAATHHIITGMLQPNVRFDKPLSREDWPCYAAGVSYVRPPGAGIPAGVTLPTFLQGGPLIWPGQHGGFLGPRHDPWQIDRDPTAPDFQVGALRLLDGLDVDTLRSRQSLLAGLDDQQRRLARSAEGQRLSDIQRRAYDMLVSGRMAQAFALDQESARVRDRYGRNLFGQSLLLARRLVEAGVPIIQANMGRVQNWDTHSGNFRRLKNELLPALDGAVATLIEDLRERGMLDDTLVICLGEFGRTPKVNTAEGGRDHWADCFSALFAGGGVRGGQVIGRSDRAGAYPASNPYSPNDLGATVYDALGIDPESELRDRLNRPLHLNRGEVIRALYTGA
jgi:uncharacterized protein (DUF1501 family)